MALADEYLWSIILSARVYFCGRNFSCVLHNQVPLRKCQMKKYLYRFRPYDKVYDPFLSEYYLSCFWFQISLVFCVVWSAIDKNYLISVETMLAYTLWGTLFLVSGPVLANLGQVTCCVRTFRSDLCQLFGVTGILTTIPIFCCLFFLHGKISTDLFLLIFSVLSLFWYVRMFTRNWKSVRWPMNLICVVSAFLTQMTLWILSMLYYSC